MDTFLDRLLSPISAILLVATLIALLGYVAPAYRTRFATDAPGSPGMAWVLWFAAGVICLISWVKLVFAV